VLASVDRIYIIETQEHAAFNGVVTSLIYDPVTFLTQDLSSDFTIAVQPATNL
jgi:hypothetical protein